MAIARGYHVSSTHINVAIIQQTKSVRLIKFSKLFRLFRTLLNLIQNDWNWIEQEKNELSEKFKKFISPWNRIREAWRINLFIINSGTYIHGWQKQNSWFRTLEPFVLLLKTWTFKSVCHKIIIKFAELIVDYMRYQLKSIRK